MATSFDNSGIEWLFLTGFLNKLKTHKFGAFCIKAFCIPSGISILSLIIQIIFHVKLSKFIKNLLILLISTI